MSVGHASNFIRESISELEGLIVQELERVNGASFNDVLGECLHLAAIAVHAGRHPTLPLNFHRIIDVNRLAIEKHFAGIGLRQRLRVIKANILDELLTQFRAENVPVRVDDAPGPFGLSHFGISFVYFCSVS
jgi:hypothetical protein